MMIPLTVSEWIADQKCHEALSFIVNGKESIKKSMSLLMAASESLLYNEDVILRAEMLPSKEFDIRTANISTRILLTCLAIRCCLIGQSQILFRSNAFCDANLPPAFSALILAEKLKTRFSNSKSLNTVLFLTINYLHVHGFDRNKYLTIFEKFSKLVSDGFMSTLSYENYVINVMEILAELNKTLDLPFLSTIQERIDTNKDDADGDFSDDDSIDLSNKFLNKQLIFKDLPEVLNESFKSTMQLRCKKIIPGKKLCSNANSTGSSNANGTAHGLVNAGNDQVNLVNKGAGVEMCETPIVSKTIDSNFNTMTLQERDSDLTTPEIVSTDSHSIPKHSCKASAKARVELRKTPPQFIMVQKSMRRKWSLKQDSLIIKCVKRYGYSWATISRQFHRTRTNVQIKDRWRVLLQKKLVAVDDSKKVVYIDSSFLPFI